MICQTVAQKVGKRVSLVEGLLRRRLRRSDMITALNATADETEDIIQSEKMEEAVDERAWIDVVRWERVEASEMPAIAPKMALAAWGRGKTMRVWTNTVATRIVKGTNDGVGESAKKANTVAVEGNMRFGWLMKITSLGLTVSMTSFQNVSAG
jgi:hypothetical protein